MSGESWLSKVVPATIISIFLGLGLTLHFDLRHRLEMLQIEVAKGIERIDSQDEALKEVKDLFVSNRETVAAAMISLDGKIWQLRHQVSNNHNPHP